MNYPIDDEITRIESDVKEEYDSYYEVDRLQRMLDDIKTLISEIKYLKSGKKSKQPIANTLFKQDEN